MEERGNFSGGLNYHPGAGLLDFGGAGKIGAGPVCLWAEPPDSGASPEWGSAG